MTTIDHDTREDIVMRAVINSVDSSLTRFQADRDAAVETARQDAITIATQQGRINALEFLLKADRDYQRAALRLLWDLGTQLAWKCPDGVERYVHNLNAEEFSECALMAMHGTLPRFTCDAPDCSLGIECGAGYECAAAGKDDRSPQEKFDARAPQYLLSALKVRRVAETKAEVGR